MRTNRKSVSGQAIAEFVVGLVAVMCLTGAMVQLGLLTLERSNAMVSATAVVSQKAVADQYTPTAVQYVTNWTRGDDNHRHSEDDASQGGDPAEIADTAGRYSLPDLVSRYDDDSPLASADDPALMVEEDSLVQGSVSKVGIRMLPVVRNWIYRDDSITIRSEAWGVWTRDID
jgi:hypothetical protein